MENEKKTAIFAGIVAVAMLSLAAASPKEHAEYWYNFPGFESIYGVIGAVIFLMLFKTLGKFNQEEGLIDD